MKRQMKFLDLYGYPPNPEDLDPDSYEGILAVSDTDKFVELVGFTRVRCGAPGTTSSG